MSKPRRRRKTSATPAGVPRSRARETRSTRKFWRWFYRLCGEVGYLDELRAERSQEGA